MADTPPFNSSQRSTPTPLALPGLRQLTQVTETEPEPEFEHRRGSRIVIHAASPTSEEPEEYKNQDEDKKISPCQCCRYIRYLLLLKKIADTLPSDSQLTSSDKLSALPSHLHASPAGRAVGSGTRRNKSNSNSPEDTLPSTITQEAQTSTLPRRAPPVSHSLSESAADYSTLPRQRISFDSERDSSTSPRPGEFLNISTHIFAPSAVTCSWSDGRLIYSQPSATWIQRAGPS